MMIHRHNPLGRMGNLAGQLPVVEFLNRIFPLSQMRFDGGGLYNGGLEEGVLQHMVRNDDWSYKDFFELATFAKSTPYLA